MSRLVSLDLGNGFCKFVSTYDSGHFPSVYAAQEPGVEFAGLAAADDFVIELDGVRYAIGWSAPRLGHIAVRTLDRSRVLGPEYQVLFAAALVAAVGQGGIIAPILSLPVSWYDRRDLVKKHLAGEWRIWRAEHRRGDTTIPDQWYNFTVPLEAIRIIPEGFGSICALALDDSGRPYNNGLLGMTVGVVDIGTKTVDLTMFDRLTYVPASTAGYEVGLERVYTIMARLAERELGHTFTIEQLDAALYDQPLYVGSRDVSDRLYLWKSQALEQVSNAIAGHIKTLWQGGQSVQRLLITGGGAQHLYEYLLKHFPDHLQPVQDGPMANALGGFRYGLLKGKPQ